MRGLAPFLVLALAACADSTSNVPSPAKVTPERGATGTEVPITITGEHFDPLVFADYRTGTGYLDAAFQAQLEDGAGLVVPLTSVQWLASHTLTAVVPATTPRGPFDLVVQDPLGRSGRLLSAFQVVTSAENVAAFVIDALTTQTAGIPFLVRLTAVDLEGSPVEGFAGEVVLSGASATPVPMGPFLRGRFRGFVTVDRPASQLTLVVEDAAGRRGSSEPFEVVTGPPARVVFVSGPARVEAGSCAGPFELEQQDAVGLPAPEATAAGLTFTAAPQEGLAFFSDAACTTESSTAIIGAGEARARLFVSSTRAGQVLLRATPAELPSAVQPLEVQPLPVDHFAFGSAGNPMSAGACSSELELQALDRFGNSAALTSPLTFELAVSPASGVTLHADSSCAMPLGSLVFAAGAASAPFSFLATAPGELTFTARSNDGGVVVAQTIEVLP